MTYEVDALQLAAEGVDATGVGLGDAVQVVDRKLGDGLRVQGRCVRMVMNELDARDVQLTLGHLSGGLAGVLGGLSAGLSSVRATVAAMNGGTMSTADYLSRLLARLNAEANATGGYTYVTEGQGLRTYDKAVSDPLVGAEASQVVELRGGTIRIADSRTSAGDWDWKTVIQSGHIAANLVTAANLTAGSIRSADGNVVVDLDSGTVTMKRGVIQSADGKSVWNLGENTFKTVGMEAEDIKATGELESSGSSIKTVIRDGGVKFYALSKGSLSQLGDIHSYINENTGGGGLYIDAHGAITERATGANVVKASSSVYGEESLARAISGTLSVPYVSEITPGTDGGFSYKTANLVLSFINGRCTAARSLASNATWTEF